MTVAVCLECGQLKRSAWATCRKCGYRPLDDESMTKHLLCTDQILDKQQLQAVSEKVRAGEEVEFNEEILKKAWVNADQVRRTNQNCLFAAIAFFLVVMGTCTTVWYYFFR